jgi:NifU-like protein involved in Fe-S cluster formation
VNQAIIKYYRQLLKDDFPYSGPIENASISVEAVGEKMVHCGNAGNYMRLHFNVADGRIADIRYLCSCEPVANVVIEILCDLVKGKTLNEAAATREEMLYERIGCDGRNGCNDDELRLKTRGLIELLKEGIGKCGSFTPAAEKTSGENIQWDLLGSPLSLTGKMK